MSKGLEIILERKQKVVKSENSWRRPSTTNSKYSYLISNPCTSRRFSAHKEPPHILQVCLPVAVSDKGLGFLQHQEQSSRGRFSTLSSNLLDPRHRSTVPDTEFQHGDRIRRVPPPGQAYCAVRARLQQQHLPHDRQYPASSMAFLLLCSQTSP